MTIDDYFPPSLRSMIEQQKQIQKQLELPTSLRAVVEQQQRDMPSVQSVLGTLAPFRHYVEENTQLARSLHGNFDILAAQVRSWQSVAESILGSAAGSFSTANELEASWGWSGRDMLEIARAFDDADLEDDDVDFDAAAADGDEHIVIPSDRSLILVTAQISDLLLERFVRHPDEIRQMAPRKFEEMIAGLFEGFGYEVELTAQTRDGGYDVVAVRHAEMTTRSLIECKRYSPDKRVGVAVVRQLRGVLASTQATNGIVATTATFTRDAQRLIAENRWLIEGRDIKGIVEWIERYLRRNS